MYLWWVMRWHQWNRRHRIPWRRHPGMPKRFGVKISMWFNIHNITYSIQQSPSSEANRFSASQEIPRILWHPKVHYRIYKCPPPMSILSHLDPAHALKSHFKIHLNIILPPKPGYSKWTRSLIFLHQNPIHPPHLSIHTRYIPRSSHYSRFYHPNSIGWGVQIIKLIIM